MAKGRTLLIYVSDWQGDPKLGACSLAARGLWFEMLCIMQDAEPFGHLSVNHSVIRPEQLARLCRGSTEEITTLLQELEDHGVFSRTEDGVIFCRRMLRDQARRERNRRNGSLGGNPRLTNSDNQEFHVRLSEVDNHPDKANGTGTGIDTGDTDISSPSRKKEGVQREGAMTVEIWPAFDDWWSLYDKKTGRAPCEAKWKRLKQDEKEAIMRHTEAYVAATPEIQYRKNPLTYLNQKSWNDEHVTRRDDPARPVTAKLERIQRMLAEREHRGAIPQARALGHADGERGE